MTRRRPFRCYDCGWRGWAVDAVRKIAPRRASDAPAPLCPSRSATGRDELSHVLDLQLLDPPPAPAGELDLHPPR